eukprot:1062382-Rhodomonas_salina.1
MLRSLEPSTSGTFTARCTPCWEAEAGVVRETLLRENESAGSLMASCPVFGSEIVVRVLFAEEEWEVLEAMRVALESINAGLEVLPNVGLRFALATAQEGAEPEGQEGAQGADEIMVQRGVLVWTTKGAARNEDVVRGWGAELEEWESELETAGEVLVSGGGRTVRMSPRWALQAVGLAYLMQHMLWERCLLVRCAECEAVGSAFRATAATMEIRVEREVQLSLHVLEQGVRRRELTAPELAARAVDQLALDDCEARVVVLLAGVEIAEAVVAAVRATGKAEQFVLLVTDAASRVQHPLHGQCSCRSTDVLTWHASSHGVTVVSDHDAGSGWCFHLGQG